MSFQLVVKVGSQPWDTGFKEGMPVEIQPQDCFMSDRMKRVFAIFKVPHRLHRLVRDAIKPGKSADGEIVRERCRYLDLEAVARKLGDPKLVDRWRGKDVVPIQDGSILGDKRLWKDSLNGSWTDTDLNSHSSGSVEVGPTSVDGITSWTAAVADIAATLTGALTYHQVGHTTEAGVTGTVAPDLVSFKLTLTSDNHPNGNPNAGWISTLSSAAALFRFNLSNTLGGGNIEVSHLNVHNTNPGGWNSEILGVSNSSYNGGPNTCHDCIVVVQNGSGTVTGITMTGTAGGAQVRAIYNNLIVFVSCPSSRGMSTTSDLGVWTVECNTVIGALLGIIVGGGSVGTYRDNIVSAGTCFAGAGLSGATGRNNASTDTTCADGNWAAGSGNQTSITLSNEVISSDPTSGACAKLKAGGVCATGGSAPTFATTGNRGNARPGTDGFYSIGADEYLATVNPTVTLCNPSSGPSTGGTPVTVTGTGFMAGGILVTFGGTPATSVSVVSTTEITCLTPAHSAGAVSIVVLNADGGSGMLPAGFTYIGPSTPAVGGGSGIPTAIGLAMAMGR